MQIFKFLKRPEKTNFELNYPKHAVTMVTDFQRKSGKLQCSGAEESIVNVSNKFRLRVM